MGIKTGHTCNSSPQLDTGGKEMKGRPRSTWRRMMEDDLSTISLTWSTVLKAAQDRRAREVLSEAPCVTGHDGLF
jgi:hypothetical protein